MKIFTKPFYVYVVDEEDDEHKVTVYVQDTNRRSRNRVVIYAQSPDFENLDEACEWGERQVEAHSK